MRKVFSEDLPKLKGYNGKRIDWKNSIGCVVRFVYDDIEDVVEILNYKNEYLTIRYKDYNDFKINAYHFKNACLGNLLKRNTSDFKIDIGEILKDNGRNLTILNKEKRNRSDGDGHYKYYEYKCNKCGYVDWMLETHMLRGIACPCCSNPVKKVVLGINTIWDTDRWMCDLGVSEEDAKSHTKGSDAKVIVKCPYCGKEKDISLSNLYRTKSIGCICGDGFSYPEKFMSEVLNQLGVDYKFQLSKAIFDWCEDYRYDFYFEYCNKKCIIETHGEQHYRQISGRWSSLYDIQLNDYLKEKCAIDNGIDEYITVNCMKSEKDFIKRSISTNTKLIKLFGMETLNNIDWNLCEEFALSNKVKEVCDQWNNKKESETTKDLSITLSLSRYSVIRYLKKGNELGFCEYNPKEEMIKNARSSKSRRNMNE